MTDAHAPSPDDEKIHDIWARCPTCDGEAVIYLLAPGSDNGNVYCLEDGCGVAHRDVDGVLRYKEGER